MRNVSPADERRPQGLRAHIHTFTMRAFSDSSAKKIAHCGPSRSSSAKNSPGTPPPTPHPIQNSPNSPFPTACAGQNSPNSSFPTACAGQNSPCAPLHTACAVQNSPCTPPSTASPVQNSPCSLEMAQCGAFCPRMANFLPLSPPTSHAGRTFSRSHPHQAEQENSSCELSRR